MTIATARLVLRAWRADDAEVFAALNGDPEVMRDLGGPLDRARSDAKLDRYRAAFDRYGFTRWCVEDREGRFLGYTGIMPAGADHPLGAQAEIGWRLVRGAWGQGYASEAASAALTDIFAGGLADEVLAYTAPDNARSIAVMARIGLARDAARDFTLGNGWRGLVWTARS